MRDERNVYGTFKFFVKYRLGQHSDEECFDSICLGNFSLDIDTQKEVRLGQILLIFVQSCGGKFHIFELDILLLPFSSGNFQ